MTSETQAHQHAANDRLQTIALARQVKLSDAPILGGPRLEPWIERSWDRCLARGFRPQQRIGFNLVSATVKRRAQDDSWSLLQAAAPVIQSLARAVADSGYFAILTDAQGVVINVNGPVDHRNRLAHLIARVGVDLSEQAVGTTAIGATLAELQPVWLHRGEHFFDDTSAYSCAGAPVFGPDGRCVGMLDLTGIHVPERPALKHLVTQSAQSIENALLLGQPHQLVLRLSWPGQPMGTAGDALLTIDTDGQIAGTNRAATQMLGLTGAPWPHSSEVFAVSPATLYDAARAERPATEVPLWSGLRVQVLSRPAGGPACGMPTQPRPPAVPLKDLETHLIRQAVQDARGNVMQAALALGISRATVYRKLGNPRKKDDH